MILLRMHNIREGNIDIGKAIFATLIQLGPSEESHVDYYHYFNLKKEEATKQRKNAFHNLTGLT